MPLTLTVTEGSLPSGNEKTAFSRLCECMLKWHGLTGNTVMTPNVVGALHVVPPQHTFSGGNTANVAFIEWKVPSFAFATREVQEGYFAEATEIVHSLSNGSLPKENIWINVIHAVDGAWGIGGNAMTNDQLKDAISKG